MNDADLKVARGVPTPLLLAAAQSTIDVMHTEPQNSFSSQERAELAIRHLHPKLAAEKLGLTVAAVMQRRKELDLPPVDVQFAKRRQGQQNNGRAK
jgi:hypothetical protein